MSSTAAISGKERYEVRYMGRQRFPKEAKGPALRLPYCPLL
ncbi:hypothetical protein [Paenibacillus sp. GCM10023250]